MLLELCLSTPDDDIVVQINMPVSVPSSGDVVAHSNKTFLDTVTVLYVISVQWPFVEIKCTMVLHIKVCTRRQCYT